MLKFISFYIRYPFTHFVSEIKGGFEILGISRVSNYVAHLFPPTQPPGMQSSLYSYVKGNQTENFLPLYYVQVMEKPDYFLGPSGLRLQELMGELITHTLPLYEDSTHIIMIINLLKNCKYCSNIVCSVCPHYQLFRVNIEHLSSSITRLSVNTHYTYKYVSFPIVVRFD